jgi:hypothetical protein
MRNRLSAFSFCIALGLGTSAAHAIPVTYDVVGFGQVCPVGVIMPACTNGVTFTGSVTLDVAPGGPSGIAPNSVLIPPELAYDLYDWVDPTFAFTWEGGSFAHRTVPGENFPDHLTQVESNPITGYEAATTRKISARDGIVDGVRDSEQNWAQIDIAYSDTSTLDIPDVSVFPRLDTLPPTAQLSFWLRDLAFTVDYNIDQILTYTGYNAYFTATSVTARPPTAVSEPSMLGLVGAGLLALAIARRRLRRPRSA